MAAFRVLAALAAAAVASAQTQNIVQIAEADPELRFLVDALVAGGLVSTLSGPGPFTVFAPIDFAFEELGRNVLDFVLNPHNVKSLDNVLTYHVVSGAVTSSQLKDGEIIPTVDVGYNVTAHVNGADVHINGARVLRANIMATNGVIHIVDGVLIPGNVGLPADTIAATAESVASLSTLVTAVTTAGLVAPLSDNTDVFTVFAPNNAAFAALPAGVLAYLLAHPAELADVLFYHLLDHRVYSEEIHNFERARTLLRNEELVFVVAGGKVLVNGNSTVLTANVQCSNGVVHIIDTVLIPNAVAAKVAAWEAGLVASGVAAPALPNIVQLAQSVADLSTLVTAVVAGGLVSTLSGAGPFTVFAPTNEAFARLPADFLAYLLKPANKAALVEVLTYHVVAGAVQSSQLKNDEIIPTVQGDNVTAHIFGRNILINEAFVSAPNNEASNGVVHIIDDVLLPY